MELYVAAAVFLLGCAGTTILCKRGKKFKTAAVCAVVSMLVLLYIAAVMLLINGID